MIQSNASRNFGQTVRTRPASHCSSARQRLQPAAGVTLILALMIGPAVPAFVRAEDPEAQAAGALRAADLLTLAELAQKPFESLPDASRLNVERIVAFEENPRFVYLAGRTGKSLRRIVLLRPGTFVVEDRVQVPAAGTAVTPGVTVSWTLLTQGKPEIDGRKLRVVGPEGELRVETLLPRDATLRIARPKREDGNSVPPAARDAVEHVVEIQTKANRRGARFLHVFQVRPPDDKSPVPPAAGDAVPRCQLVREDSGRLLTVTTATQTLKLSLPGRRDAAGTIAIAAADGQALLSERLLPSGVMPHGEEGVRLLRRWDTPYHDGRRPGWDTGRVAPELKKLAVTLGVTEQDKTPRGRAVVLGCGTGTNAIYLAGKGFEVTGVDVAPTALIQAQQKARKEGVDVRWVVADVLALPELPPVDLIFDRGCYHHVRQYDAAGYVRSVQRLSRGGTRLLLLAGSAKQEGSGGPPRIKEEEIRNDFSASFQIEWLREIRFDSANPDATGPLAWSVLLRCKEKE